MSFLPRRLADGRICCSNAAGLCATCRAHLGLPPFTDPATERVQMAANATERLKHHTMWSANEYQPQKEHTMSATRAIPPDPYAIALRAAVGARHSAADQQHLDLAAVHLHQVGATCPPMTDEAEPKAAALSPGERIARKIQGFGSVVTSTPDPYAKGTTQVAERADAIDHVMGLFAARGLPPDPYAIGLALRKLDKENN